MVGCFLVPLLGFGTIFGAADTLLVHDADIVLSSYMFLFGSKGIPVEGLTVVFAYALTLVVHDAEIVLSIGIALFGSKCEPVDGLLVVLFHPILSHGIDKTEEALCIDVAIGGSLSSCLDIRNGIYLFVGLSLECQRKEHEQDEQVFHKSKGLKIIVLFLWRRGESPWIAPMPPNQIS